MSKSEKIKLKGRELANRLTGISTPAGGISWKPPVDERGKAQRLLVYLAGQRALHYPYDREIGSFVVQSILDTRERLTRDIEDLSVDSILRQILRGMQAACRNFLDENQSPSAGYGWPYKAIKHSLSARTAARTISDRDVSTFRYVLLPFSILEKSRTLFSSRVRTARRRA